MTTSKFLYISSPSFSRLVPTSLEMYHYCLYNDRIRYHWHTSIQDTRVAIKNIFTTFLLLLSLPLGLSTIRGCSNVKRSIVRRPPQLPTYISRTSGVLFREEGIGLRVANNTFRWVSMFRRRGWITDPLDLDPSAALVAARTDSKIILDRVAAFMLESVVELIQWNSVDRRKW